jgi:hypothetical protein
MTSILDSIFYHSLYVFAVDAALLIAGIGLGTLRPFRNNAINLAYRCFCYSLFAQWIIAALFLSPRFGYADSFVKGFIDGRKLFLLEETISSSPGEGGQDRYYRLYAVDVDSGERLYRAYLGDDAELIAMSDGKLVYRITQDYVVMDAKTLGISRTYRRDALPSEYPQLMPGVSGASYRVPFLELDSKNGRRYYLEPASGRLFSARPERGEGPPAGYSVERHEVIHVDPFTGKRDRVLWFEAAEQGRMERIAAAGQVKAPPSMELIAPKFLEMYPGEHILLVLSYETTDQDSFILSAVDCARGSVLWRLKQSDIDDGDHVENHAALTISIRQGQDYIFNSGGLLLRVNAKSGNILWKVKQ